MCRLSDSSLLCASVYSGSFSCLIKNDPSIETIVSHLQAHGFHVVSRERKDEIVHVHFYGHQSSGAFLLGEFVLVRARRFFQATFKCRVRKRVAGGPPSSGGAVLTAQWTCLWVLGRSGSRRPTLSRTSISRSCLSWTKPDGVCGLSGLEPETGPRCRPAQWDGAIQPAQRCVSHCWTKTVWKRNRHVCTHAWQPQDPFATSLGICLLTRQFAV